MDGTPMNPAEIRRMYEDHGAALTLYARSIAGDFARAEDAVQGVFLRLLEGRVPAPRDARPYLWRAVRNAALNTIRDAKREEPLVAGTDAWFEPDAASEAGEAAERALGLLPAEQREVVVLKIWGGLTFEEISDLTGLSANTAASRYRYALEKMRNDALRHAER
jgi:RNA polymerase sigma-70 factor (ECF subfamily)